MKPRIVDNYIPTPKNLEIAVEVMRHSSMVKRWLEGEAFAFGMDINSAKGKAFAEKRGKELAQRLLKQDRRHF